MLEGSFLHKLLNTLWTFKLKIVVHKRLIVDLLNLVVQSIFGELHSGIPGITIVCHLLPQSVSLLGHQFGELPRVIRQKHLRYC